ncbi:MAG: fused MFS/spermidine synthase [Rhodospirillaceae bacterium]|jgi:hypothetical protein|nr:fused MFS/spermidine synthase [Rhodospirillaceae bacterium]MBT5459926.1 fused MFS/spermidine synthase [Rhodospirillaceae bacterium]
METNEAAIARPAKRLIDQALIPLFGLTLFTSAGLLFWIQPLFAKMALPLLGGAPAVWNTAMMFFQGTLLLGYGYVHFVNLKLPPKWQVFLHLFIVAIALYSLPVAVQEGYDPGDAPVAGLVILFAMSIGLPFFAVSATAPLLQRWFARSGHRHAEDPYFLYGASNLGSILALLAFPFFLEPNLDLREQAIAWSAGVIVLLLLIALCTLLPGGKSASYCRPQPRAVTAHPGARNIWRERGLWIAFSFAPSSLLLGVTQHISTDVAAVPLLWVIPLTLYLLSFVVVFAQRPILPHEWVIRLQPYFLVLALVGVLFQGNSIWLSASVHLTILFLLALSCHGELVKHRPDVNRLTEFYLCMSVGGLLGGAFNVLAAPLLFDGIYEYGLAVVVAVALRPGVWGGSLRKYSLDMGLPLAILVLALTIHNLDLPPGLAEFKGYARVALFCVIGILVFGFKERPLRFALGIGAALAFFATTSTSGDFLSQSRSFFGVYRVKTSDDGLARQLYHGTTMHGAQLLAKPMALEPVSYYSRQGPLGQAFETIRGRRPDLRVGLVGLGVGASLCYSKPADQWTIFELDPLIVKIARDDNYFTFLRDCDRGKATNFLVGDARLQLNNVPSSSFDLMVLDAYSSDAVPLHLLTREALTLYRTKLAPGGILMFHVSNRYLHLDRVLSALVDDASMSALLLEHKPGADAPKHATASHWIAVAEQESDISALKNLGKWRSLEPSSLRPWTDGYSNIIRVLR